MRPATARAILTALFGMIVLGSAVYFSINQTIERAVAFDAERKARSWAAYLTSTMPGLDRLIETGTPYPSQFAVIEVAEKIGDVFRFKLFDRKGHLTLVSDQVGNATESAAREHSEKAANVVRTGVSNISLNDGSGTPDRPPLYVEAEVPIVR